MERALRSRKRATGRSRYPTAAAPVDARARIRATGCRCHLAAGPVLR
jgi:hypothetical protein